MKRIYGVIALIVAAAGVLFGQPAQAANTNNFSITSYDIQYELSRDSESRSVLKATETIVAQFPDYDQNHGLERALPTEYNGHPTHLKINAVTDGNGHELEYSTNDESGVLILRIGDADSYVHGTQSYQIIYTQYDVTQNFSTTGRDEWYWDTNGTEWQVPINSLTISMKFTDDLVAVREGEPYCYEGSNSSNALCTITSTGEGTYETSATNLTAGENVTVAFGFTKGTFAEYQPSSTEQLFAIWNIIVFVTTIIGFILLAFMIVRYGQKKNRTKETPLIPAEYIPPKNTSVTVSAQVITARGSVFAAQLIDLAVRHIISIIETKPKGTWTAAEYDIKVLVDVSKLADEEREILEDMFEGIPAVGVDDRLPLKSLRNNMGYFTRTSDNDIKLKVLIRNKYGIREKSKTTSWYFYRWAIGMGVVALLTISIPLLVMAGIVAAMGVMIVPLTDKGLELRRYLLGLDKYIQAAEAERLKFLQGPDTAVKVGEKVDVNNPGQILKLYERVLPYAILFGREKEWTKRLGEFYASTQTNPDWYNSSNGAVFNAVLFSTAVSSFSSAASYSGGSSSSSGGSSGGGSSGGGGGGGGGGGW